MQHSAIYDPRAEATPSQADAANQRLARLRRIGSHARADTPIILRRAAVLVAIESPAELAAPVVDRELLLELWVERQRQKHADALRKVEERAASSDAKRPPPVELIQRIVAEYYGFEWRIMSSSRRAAIVVRPRQVAMYLAKTMTDRSLPDIGRRFGGRDHTTVLHAVRKIAGLINIDTALAANVEQLKSLIEAKIP